MNNMINNKYNKKQSIQNIVTNNLRKAILTGEYKQGDKIVQEELAKRYGVSRMPIREAIKKLEFEGIIKSEPRRGAFAYPIGMEDIEEIYTLRLIHESLAVEKALPYITDEDIEELEKIIIKMENLDMNDETFEYYSRLNEEFHNKLIEKCPWKRVVQNARIFWGHYLSIGTTLILTDHHEKVKQEHRQIFDAVTKKDTMLLKNTIEYHIRRNMNELIVNIQK
ncbi:GntR family transcriptional regulator [Oceanobacillus jeddahense]|uniref:GntR family transcriptional regulator n=1 Tax=Oceanobacillus jeddahense TaxID=1462527 RepID=A0ABY5JSP4_9BACI|nr:GntR family transcriptional regulator [Oceanobacillus jeddahense]UUI02472.1 GntR family transcriptional regulator [Oceanobacillus jeddahense]